MRHGQFGRYAGVAGSISGKGLLAVIVWGASFAATRVALDVLTPFGLVAVRLWAGALLLALVLRLRGGALLRIRRDMPVCLFLGTVLAVHLLLQAYGLQRTTAVHTGWIIGFIPVTIALGAWLRGQQRLRRRGWVGVALGTVGVLIVTWAEPPSFAEAQFGDLLQVASCLTWTVYTLASTGPISRNGALRVTTLGMVVAASLATIAAVGGGLSAGAWTWNGLLAVAFLGPVCSGVAYALWFAAQREHGPARLGALLYIEPFVALATGTMLLGEPVTLHALVGGLAVLAGVWLVSHSSARPVVAAPEAPA